MYLYLCKQTFHIAPVRVTQKAKGVIMRNLRDIILYVKTKILIDFHICIRVPLRFRKLGNFKKTPEMRGFDGEYPAIHPKAKFWSFLVQNCKQSAVKDSTEKPILLNFVNLSPTFCPRLYPQKLLKKMPIFFQKIFISSSMLQLVKEPFHQCSNWLMLTRFLKSFKEI